MRFLGTDPTRSRIMAQIRGRGNRSTEKKARACLMRAGIRGWRLNVKEVIGRPDIYFHDKKIAIFINGCFWHGCKKCYRRPKSRQEYWDWKVERNKQRDRRISSMLKRKGIHYIRIWEHELQTSPSLVMNKIINEIQALRRAGPGRGAVMKKGG